MTDIEGRLRGASDSLLEGLDRLAQLEETKRGLTPGTPAFVKAAAEVTQLAHELLQASALEERLAAHTVELRVAGSAALPEQPIEDMAPRDLADILVDWRAAERQLAEAAPGSPEAVSLAATVSRLRDEYQRAHDAEAGKDV
jgi:hypothetical protein